MISVFLKRIIAATDLLTKVSPKQMIGIKDIRSNHIYCSDYLLELMGATAEQTIGKKIWLPLYGDDPNFEKIILDEDQKIITSREPQTLLKINNFTSGLTPYFCRKSPIINPDNNSVEGIITQGYEVGLTGFKNYFVRKTNTNNSLNSDIHLTKREKQVIYFFMSHLSSQEIADVLSDSEGKSISKKHH